MNCCEKCFSENIVFISNKDSRGNWYLSEEYDCKNCQYEYYTPAPLVAPENPNTYRPTSVITAVESQPDKI